MVFSLIIRIRQNLSSGTESRDYYSFEAPDGEMIYDSIFGRDYKEILSQYVGLTGKPIMPPKWALGFAQRRGLLTSEKLSREIAEGYRTRGVPCDIIYQDIGWTDDIYRTSNGGRATTGIRRRCLPI